MSLDRSARSLLAVIALALVALAARAWVAPAPAGAGPRAAEAQIVLSVPRDYGRVVGFLGTRAFFEAADGTLRGVQVDAAGAAPVVTLIQRR
jgi:hypothetical protein